MSKSGGYEYNSFINMSAIKASSFLNYKDNSCLLDVIQNLQRCIFTNSLVATSLVEIEFIFDYLLREREMCIKITPLKPKDNSADTKNREWLQERYYESLKLVLLCFNLDNQNDSKQALKTAMTLLAQEAKYPLEKLTPDSNQFPLNRFRNILMKLLTSEKINTQMITWFKDYGCFLDVVYYAWKLLPNMTLKGASVNEIYIQNYLYFITTIAYNSEIQETPQYLFASEDQPAINFEYGNFSKYINKCWNCVQLWELKENSHKQILIALLEQFLPHLEKPLLLTDFLMESLDVGGPISLLALQGIFILCQHNNLTYPNIYEKLYAMFEPEIFHTKYKARLFYLADIFLSSTHLPESLIAAFVKRLARLGLVAQPQDTIIILYFIGNLILRHPALKRMKYKPIDTEVVDDPYIMDERDPIKSNAVESSLWEITSLRTHAIPSVAQAARFIFKTSPRIECDLSKYLKVNENDEFDQEIVKQSKERALTFERSQSNKTTNYWKL